MTFSIIKKSQLEGALRLDAEYYKPEYLALEKSLQHTQKLVDISGKIICGPFGSAILNSDYKKCGTPLLRVADLNDWLVNDSNLVYINNDLSQTYKKYQVEDGDIVVSQRGTIAQFSKVTDKFAIWNISANLISIKKSNKVNFNYLLAFLNCKYGISQLSRNLSGQVQPKITTDDIKTIKIFVPEINKQNEIAKLAENSENELGNSESFYHQAEKLLLKELGLENFKAEKQLFSIVNLSDCQKANRIDAEYFSAEIAEIQERIKHIESNRLSDNFQIIGGKYFDYMENGNVGVIKTKQLGSQFINYKVESKTQDSVVQKENLPLIKDFDILFASMGIGSLGKTNIYYEFENKGKYTIDSTIKIFRRKVNSNYLPETLQVFLSSKIGQKLIYQNIVGSSGIISIYEKYIENLPMPVLPKSTQQQIADLVKKSHVARQKSKELLEQAKRKVEELIEKGQG